MVHYMIKLVFRLLLIVGVMMPTVLRAESYVVRDYPIGTTVTLGGTVVPYKEVMLSAQLPGRVEMLAGTEGDHFNKETVLVALNDRDLQAQRRAAIAEMMNAESVLRNANVQYSRELYSPNSPGQMSVPGGMGMPNLFDQFFSRPMGEFLGQNNTFVDRQAELYNFGTQIDQARNAMMRTQAQIEQIDEKLRDAVGKAPFDGVIVKKMVEVGDTVQPGQPLIKFADTQYLQIQVEVPARLINGISVGSQVSAKLDNPNQIIQVRTAQIFPSADPQRHTITTKFDLPIGTRTGAGQYAQVELQDPNLPVYNLPVIPRAALTWRGSLPSVYVLQGDKRSLRLVRLGREMDANYVSILSGLQSGDVIEIQASTPAPTMVAPAPWTSQPVNALPMPPVR